MKTTFEPTKTQFLYIRKPTGVFYARTYAGGKSQWVSLGTKVRSIAKQKLAKLLTKHLETRDARRDVEAGSATVGQLSQVYLQSQQLRTDIRASTKGHKGFITKSLFDSWPELRERVPSRVTEHDFAEWASRHHAEWSPTKHNSTIDILRGIFEIAVSRGMISSNPVAKLPRAKVQQKQLQLPSPEQFREIVKIVRSSGASSSRGNGDLIEFLAYSGCRIQEAARVRWMDVDEATGRLWIQRGKSGQGRHVPILPAMSDLLKRIKDEKRHALARPARFGHVLVTLTCEEALERACAKTGVPRMTHHSLRHLFATRALQSGVDVRTVAGWLGHRDGGALLLKTYAHLLDHHSQQMAQRVQF
jgi:integrase